MTVSRSIHISANDTVLHLSMAEWHPIAHKRHTLLTHSSVDGSCFLQLYRLALLNFIYLLEDWPLNLRVHINDLTALGSQARKFK